MRKIIPMYHEGFDANSRITNDPSKITHDTGLKSKVVLRFKGGRYAIGAIERGKEARQIMNGPKVPGPWAFTYQLSTCITANPAHSTKAESDRLIAEGLEFEVSESDVLVIDDAEYTVEDHPHSSRGSRLELVPCLTPEAAVTAILGEDAPEPTPMPTEEEATLVRKADEYARNYQRQYSTDEETTDAIRLQHYAYLKNRDGVEDKEEADTHSALTVALFAFARASATLQEAWGQVHDDGNHPIVTAGAYPFRDSFDEIDRGIQIWVEAVREGAPKDDVPELLLDSRAIDRIVTGVPAIEDNPHGFGWTPKKA